jgi:hypothetical protein
MKASIACPVVRSTEIEALEVRARQGALLADGAGAGQSAPAHPAKAKTSGNASSHQVSNIMGQTFGPTTL